MSQSLELGFWDVLIRMLFSMVIGAVVGTEREYTHRPAGMRTHMLVSLGSCSVALTSQFLFTQYNAVFGATPDPARLSAQVIAGVGFLGAGTIMKEGASVKGLTTAASLWTVACLGLAVGAGYYFVGLIGLILMLVTLILFEYVQHKLLRNTFESRFLNIRTSDLSLTMERCCELAKSGELKLSSMKVDATDRDHGVLLTFHAEAAGRRAPDRIHEFIAAVSSGSEVLSADTAVRHD